MKRTESTSSPAGASSQPGAGSPHFWSL